MDAVKATERDIAVDVVKATERDISCIMHLIEDCIKDMESQRIFMWNKEYPNVEIIEDDVINGFGYIMRHHHQCIAYVSINEIQSPEYNQIIWITDGRKVLVIHRLSVHPLFQGKGIAGKLMNFIEDYAVKNHYSCIRFDAYSENTRALRLYDRMGYRRSGQVFFPFKELPFYCYEKAII